MNKNYNSKKQTWKDKESYLITRDKFQPRVSDVANGQKITHPLDAPYFWKKNIELQVTNDLGYTKPHPKNGKEIFQDEFNNYLKELDDICNSQSEESKSFAIKNLLHETKNWSQIADYAVSVFERGLERVYNNMEQGMKDLEEEKQYYERELNSQEEKYKKDMTEKDKEISKLRNKLNKKEKKENKKGLFSRLF
ncbi:MAG TPA: hypothetical protein VJ912_02905 [Candidatus Nanoarchaeia archaeon]|nr:hypothetical protein [Candidatus Nanoarchaeia archaeon]